MTEPPQGATGPSVDKHGNEVIDPTKNVLDLVAAAIARQDDLREAEKEHVLRAIDNMREYIAGQVQVVQERLNGIDKASEILSDTVTRVPTQAQVAVGNLRAVSEEKFSSIATQFKERDTRQERESRDNKVAVDAAFAAQKEAAAKAEENTSKLIEKFDASTAETISKLQDLTATQDKGLSDKIDDLKERVQRIESRKVGAAEQEGERQSTSAEHRQNTSLLISIIGAVILLLGFFGYQATRNADPIVISPTPASTTANP